MRWRYQNWKNLDYWFHANRNENLITIFSISLASNNLSNRRFFHFIFLQLFQSLNCKVWCISLIINTIFLIIFSNPFFSPNLLSKEDNTIIHSIVAPNIFLLYPLILWFSIIGDNLFYDQDQWHMWIILEVLYCSFQA